MLRKIIKIDEAKCNGCGVCADACHEGAIGIVEGKAKLLREDYKWPEEVRAQANDIIGKSLVHEREMVEGFITRAQNSGRIRSDVPQRRWR